MFSLYAREKILQQYPAFPTSDYSKDVYTYPDRYASYILGLSHVTERVYTRRMAHQLCELFDALKFREIIFLADSESPWSIPEKPVHALKSAAAYFNMLLPAPNFNGGVIVPLNKFEEFIIRLFTLTRSRLSFPLVYFMDAESRVLVNICQFGNVHLDVISDDFREEFDNALQQTQFNTITGQCVDRMAGFKGSGGRGLIV